MQLGSAQYKIKLCSTIFETNLQFQIYVLIGHHCKTQPELSDLPEKDRIDLTSCKVMLETNSWMHVTFVKPL